METVKYSLIVPIYKNEGSIPDLISAINGIAAEVKNFETVFVIDGVSDNSLGLLRERLPSAGFKSTILLLSKNYGSFAAIRAGFSRTAGECVAVMAADLQEPPEMVVKFFNELSKGDCDIVLGVRESREDPWFSKVMSSMFWAVYRKFIQREMPKGGIDMFACTKVVRDELLALCESNTTLVGLLLWLGFRRKTVGYHRRHRVHGKSAWSFRRKLRYLLDSIFAFSDLPIRALTFVGLLGLSVSVVLTFMVLIAKLTGMITVPGYAMTVIAIGFLGGLNSFGLGIIGEYLWRTFENTKRRPTFIVQEIVPIKSDSSIS